MSYVSCRTKKSFDARSLTERILKKLNLKNFQVQFYQVLLWNLPSLLWNLPFCFGIHFNTHIIQVQSQVFNLHLRVLRLP
uniref:Uncharacterized protein n=1 Tax=Arundo donax TaxID=35708 RepID=A0A0A9FE34_ARUDO